MYLRIESKVIYVFEVKYTICLIKKKEKYFTTSKK